MSEGCLHNWPPTVESTVGLEGASVLPHVRMEVHDLPAKRRPESVVFHVGEAPVEFMFCISGGMQIIATDGKGEKHYAQILEGQSSILYLPHCTGHSIITPNKPIRLVNLQISPSHLGKLAGVTGCPLHMSLKQIVQGHDGPFFLESGRLPLPIKIVVEHIIANTTDSSMRTIFMEYKKIELLYLHLNLLETEVIRLHSAKPQNLRVAYAARDILMRDFANPPGLQELASRVGMNRSQLNSIFRSVFGDTVFGMVRKARLECARKMLEDGNSTVTEVAYECGFSSPSHLTVSFSKTFGMAPKQYQAEFNVCKEATETLKLKISG